MDLDIHSTVFHPARPDEPYLVQASAIAEIGITARGRRDARRSAAAATLDEARRKCCELACALRHALQDAGYKIRRIKCTHCPTPEAPPCGSSSLAEL